MHSFVSLQGQIKVISDSRIIALSDAALYGKGIFTTVAIYHGKPFLWEKHWKRLENNAVILSIDLSEFSEETVKGSLNEIITGNNVENGRTRITFFDESPSAIWPFEPTRRTSLLIMTAEFREPPAEFRLGVSPYGINSTSPLAGIKSCNYLEKIMALDEAKQRGFHEAIQLNERGEIASTCLANLFWLKDERLYTPSLKTACLPGTTREFVLENLECEEVEAGMETLRKADAIFLTSAGIGVVQAAEFNDRRFSKTDHRILELINENLPPVSRA